jgi:hypothetical protein
MMMDTGIMAAVIGSVGALSSAVVTALLAQRPYANTSSSTSIKDAESVHADLSLPTSPRSWTTVVVRIVGIALVGVGVGLLSGGTAIYGANLPGRLMNESSSIGSFCIGLGAACLASGVLTILYRRLP